MERIFLGAHHFVARELSWEAEGTKLEPGTMEGIWFWEAETSWPEPCLCLLLVGESRANYIGILSLEFPVYKIGLLTLKLYK